MWFGGPDAVDEMSTNMKEWVSPSRRRSVDQTARLHRSFPSGSFGTGHPCVHLLLVSFQASTVVL